MFGGRKLLVVGVAECLVTEDPEAILVTYALGSCVAVVAHDPVVPVGGLLHLMLPQCSLDPRKAKQNPFMFADSGVPLLLNKIYRKGADPGRLVVRIAGGARIFDNSRLFNIGERNCAAVRNVLRYQGISIRDESVGGTDSRSVSLELGSGQYRIKAAGVSGPNLLGRSR